MMVHEIKTPDHIRLRYGHVPATDGPARGPLVFFQGRTEFAEKYADLFDGLAQRGFDVWSLDWRGQGGSQRLLKNPHKGHIDDFSTYLNDLDFWLETAVGLSPQNVFTGMGHSMGGHMALRYVLEKPRRMRALLVCAPMLDIHMPFGLKPVSGGIIAVSKTMGWMERYAPGQGDFNLVLFSFLGNALTHDGRRFERLKKHLRTRPEVQLGGVTLGWVAASTRSMNAVRRGLLSTARFPCPAKALLADQDRVVMTRAAVSVLSHLENMQVEVLSPARHDIPQETPEIRARMWAAVDEVLCSNR